MAWIGLLIGAGSGVVAALAVALVVSRAAAFGLVQAPNSRSSHIRPTPTGGGVGIVLGSTFAGLFALGGQPLIVATILVASLGFAALGLWDDIRPLPALVRLATQLLLTGITAAAVLMASPLGVALGAQGSMVLVFALLVVLVVYWLNLYNFMDGIDGIAGSEAIFLLLAPLGMALIGTPAITAAPLFWWPVGVAAAVFAFLFFNWEPARIFMGDVGSTFLGFLTAVFWLLEITAGWLSPWEMLILAACFATDGTLTLLRRLLQGEAVLTAHRRHAYQHMARRFGSHQRVVLVTIAINIVWLLPLAAMAHAAPQLAPLLTLIAYPPLVALAMLAGAGRPEHA